MSFITVRYGSGEERLFNANVLVPVLLQHIKQSCGYSNIIEPLDLSTEDGHVVDLYSLARAGSKEYARKFLETRAVYVLVKVLTETTEDEATNYVPLLDGNDKVKFTVQKKSKRNPVKESEESKQAQEKMAPKRGRSSTFANNGR